MERVARATGLEVRAKYNNYTRHRLYGDHRGLSCFSPVINVMRDPRWGRNQVSTALMMKPGQYSVNYETRSVQC